MLSIRDLRRSYGEVVALDGVSFDVPRGAMVGFVGRNGAGKTTTMRAVMGVVRPDRGTVTWDGEPIDEQARLAFGYMPEERGLYPKMRVRDQLVYFGRLSGMPASEARQAADHWIERLGVAERADGVVDELSLGNQQRVQLGAALVHSPQLLVLDEPFSGLDPVGVDVLGGVLRQQADDGAAIVFSSHQLELIERLCDEVVIIEAGRIVRDTPSTAGGPPAVRVTLEVLGADVGWPDELPGVTVESVDDDRFVLLVDAQAGTDGVLSAAQAAGSVQSFAVGSRSLTERFREVLDR